MNTTPKRFDNAIAALVKGYLKGTLAKGSCQACAVGNMIAAGLNDQIEMKGISAIWRKNYESTWHYVFVTTGKNVKQRQIPENYCGITKLEIDSTGYTWQELALVESAFEKATNIWLHDYFHSTPEEIDADQLAGLMAVVDVLCQIDGITDPAPYKAQFDRATNGKSLPLADVLS